MVGAVTALAEGMTVPVPICITIKKKKMPIPQPLDSETKKQYAERCMSDSTMMEEYPTPQQRYAVCMYEWKKSIKG